MGKNVVAERYAQALFEVGQKHDQSEAFYGTLDLLQRYLEQYPDLQRLLYNPLIRPQDKKELILELMTDRTPTLFLNFVRMVIDNRRERLFPSIRDYFAKLYNRSRRRVAAQVTTAVQMKDEIADLLKQQLKARLDQEVILETRVDPQILGGAVLQIGDKIIDGSVRGRLYAIAQSLN
ncbi:MAG: F0F1 ATP synthase subunit delta [Nevskia sp.]|nr:F0F1 ATP synthase subunit delta [Nevskia sp.]